MEGPLATAGRSTRPPCSGGVSPDARLEHEGNDGPVLCVHRRRLRGRGDRACQHEQKRPRRVGCGRPTTATGAPAVAHELHAGMVWLNDHLPGPTGSCGAPGAFRAASAPASTLGKAGLRACAQEKLITWDPPRTRGLWWSPHHATTARAASAVARLR